MSCNFKKNEYLNIIFVLILYCMVIYLTVIHRTPMFVHEYKLTLFWSYSAALKGNLSLIKEILLNIIMFIPIGFFLSSICVETKSLKVLMIIGLSLMIEIMQLISCRGLFEFDDVISNTIGGVLGIIVYYLLFKFIKGIIFYLELLFLLCGLVVCFVNKKPDLIIEKEVVFQIENSDNGLEGYCFIKDTNASEKYSIILKNENKEIELSTKSRIVNEDVNQYFACEYDYSSSGFKANLPAHFDGKYSVYVKYENYGLIDTGTTLNNGIIQYCDAPEIISDGYIKELINEGTLLGYFEHCWIYQYKCNLYWIIDNNYELEDDGTTYIQYQLWTTQKEKLPTNRTDHGYSWDNVGFYFEDNEMDSCGMYRVAKRPLPTEYAITAITTGYFKDKKWQWQIYFRPIVSELMKEQK